MKENYPISQQETLVPKDQFIYSTTDLKGIITSVNDEFVEISGFSREELLGRSHNMVRHPGMPPEAFADMWRDIESGRPWQGVVKNRRKDGGFYWVEANVSPIREHGQIVGYGSVRRCPTRESINAAEEAYRVVKSGSSSITIKHGRVFKTGLLSGLCPGGLLSQLRLIVSIALIGLVVASFGFFLPNTELIWPGLAVSGISLFVALFVLPSYLQSRMQGLRDGIESLQRSGNLTAHVPVYGFGALSEIAQGINALVIDIETVLREISGGAQRVAEGASSLRSNLALAVDAQSGISNSASATAATLEQVTVAINETAENAALGASAARENMKVSEEASHEAASALVDIKRVAEQINAAGKSVLTLGEHSKCIGNMASVIKDIAEQTNLLALNAAIEAARAGEQGRGFAVVADEVRKLAERTSNVTTEINQTIQMICREITSAVDQMHVGQSLMDVSVQRTGTLESSFAKIRSTARIALDSAEAIADASREQALATDDIASNVERMAHMINEQSKSVGIMESVAIEFKEISELSRRKLTHFQI